MNDLAFGATLLSCFALLVATVTIEATAQPQQSAALSAAARSGTTLRHVARVADQECPAPTVSTH